MWPLEIGPRCSSGRTFSSNHKPYDFTRPIRAEWPKFREIEIPCRIGGDQRHNLFGCEPFFGGGGDVDLLSFGSRETSKDSFSLLPFFH